MNGRRFALGALLALCGVADVYSQDYFKVYEEGLKAASAESWPVVVQKMNEAIRGNPTEGRVRPYGNIFRPYYPYYYRAVAYLNLGEFQKAIDDLKRTKGKGEIDLGDIASLRNSAETKLAQTQAPPIQTVPSTTTAVVTSPPAVDQAVRSAAEQMVAAARSRRNDAQAAGAGSLAAAEFSQAAAKLSEALNRQSTADSTADWRAVEKTADEAKRLFDLAINSAETALAHRQAAPERAADAVVAQTRRNVKDALVAYFDGDFTDAEKKLNRLVANEQKNNAMLWAFLGAARYYSWYLNGAGNAKTRQDAEAAFKRARQLRPQLQLEDDYFSPRVRRFYRDLQG